MTTGPVPRHEFPLQFSLEHRTVILRPLANEDCEAMLAFAQGLPEEDLLFLERDITEQDEVDAWLKDDAAGRLVTLVAVEDGAIIGYATFERGSVRWTRHVAELRVAVLPSARGIGLGRLLLELAFELVLNVGVTKVIARMTPDQTGALQLFQRLGFRQEALLRDHALGTNGITHDLLVLSFRPRMHKEQCCDSCGIPVLEALSLEGSRLCSHCYESRYSELGGG
jgi:L-amino acid N-acyltransferase YncA